MTLWPTDGKWILDGHTPVPVDDLLTWAAWFEVADRIVASTDLGDVRISTVFLGLDHRFGAAGPPLLFETMIFGGPEDQYTDRYATWAEAEVGHRKAVEIAELAEAAK